MNPETSLPAPPPRPILLVGAGARARAYAEVIARSPRLKLAARVARHPEALSPPVPPLFDSLSPALAAYPDAPVLVALPPRSGLEAALTLARSSRAVIQSASRRTRGGRRALVEAPLHLALAEAELPDGAVAVELAHGWVTLPGRRLAERLIAERAIERATFDVRGLPASAEADLEETLWHALALVRRLFPRARVVESARPEGRVVTASLEDERCRIALTATTTGRELHVGLEGPRTMADWSLQDGEEIFGLRGEPRPPGKSPRPATERALVQLLESSGETLVEGQAIARLLRGVLERLPERLPPSRRRLAQAVRISQARPAALLEQLGLRGEVPEAPSASVAEQPEGLGEVWAFRAGLKPVVFLTLAPEAVDRALARYGAVHVERRERRVETGPQDTWNDQRDRGEARVELYLSRDPALARKAAAAQALGDPTAQVRALGELMGYPACCVEAFAAQDDRANNTRNRYETWARTRSPRFAPELNNLVTVSVPFFPCRFDCAAAIGWARRAGDELERADAARAQRRGDLLARPALYFDHERVVVFEGVATSPTRVEYRRAQTGSEVSADFARFAGALSLGDALELDQENLTVFRAGQELFRLTRTDPALGFLAPFGE